MAKLTGPFFSLKASGQLGKTLVAFPWKGINALRTYVIPANPRSIAQRQQRGYFEDAVDEWHAAAYNPDDVAAWNCFAGILPKIMSGFNAMIKTFVDEAILGNSWHRLCQNKVTKVTASGFKVEISLPAGDATPTIYRGLSKTFFPTSQGMDITDPTKPTCTYADLTKNTLYYYYIDVGVSGTSYGRTGIYSQRTAAA